MPDPLVVGGKRIVRSEVTATETARIEQMSAPAVEETVAEKTEPKRGFEGTVPSSEANEAVARIQSQKAGGAVHAQLGAKAKPLAPFAAMFSDVKLTRVGDEKLPSIAGVAVKGETSRMEGVASSIHADAYLTTDGVLGKLTQAQFTAVHAEMGGKSRVPFDAARKYRVSDFLPPVVQALVNKDLEIPEPITLKGTKRLSPETNMTKSDITLALTMNCHASAYEAVRAYQGNESKLAVFYGEMISMDGIVADDKAFTKLGSVAAKDAADLVAKLDLKPGDIVQFQEVSEWARMTMLLHSAVYVGGGLFFEKPNTEGPEKSDPAKYVQQDETPYRLTTVTNMLTPVSNFVEGKFTVDVFRAKAQLADPHEAFGSSMEADVNAWAAKKGRSLGVELVLELEQGSGGGIHAEHASALVRTDVKIGADGRGTLA